MVEVYSFDITPHEQFARAQEAIEAFRKQYHIPPGGAKVIASQTRVLDFVPKHPAIVLLMQTYQKKLRSLFTIPPNYYTQRFTTSYLAPSLGPEKQEADIHKIEAFVKSRTKGRKVRKKEERDVEGQKEGKRNQDEELTDEGDTIINMMEKGVKETNEMIDFVIGRMHQFIQA